jgi:lipoteichoic acid synthase
VSYSIGSIIASYDGRKQSMRILRSIPAFIVRQLDIVAAVGFLMFKMYLFAKFLDLVFVKLSMIMVSLGSVLLLCLIPLLLRGRVRIIVTWILAAWATFIIYADLVYFRYFGDLITTPVLIQFKQVSSLGGSIGELMAWKDIIFFLDLIIIFPLLLVLYKYRRSIFLNVHWAERITLTVISCLIGLYLVITPIQHYTDKYGKNLFINTWSNVSVYNITGQLGFHAFETNKYIKENIINKPTITKEEKEEIKTWYATHEIQSNEAMYGVAKGKNVIVIQLESFQNFVIGKEVNGREITPNLNQLVDDSMYFSNFYHQVGQGRTSDAEFITNNSLYPLPTGSVYIRYASNEYNALPRLLKREGYNTNAFHSYAKSFWNRSMMYATMGFDTFYGPEDLAAGQLVGPFSSLGDDGIFQQMVDLTKAQQPFYNFIVALSSHHPYSHIPQEHRELDVGKYEGDIFGNYLQSTHYVDKAVGNLIKRLKDENMWDNTILVLYGDHDSGVEIDQEKAAYIGLETDEFTLAEVKHNVPFFIHIPGTTNNGEFEHTTGNINFAPTLLNLLGIDADKQYYMGQDMMSMNDTHINFRYGSFINGDYFYNASKDGLYANGSCYNYKTHDKVDNNQCKPGFDKTLKELQISDRMIYNNLLREFNKDN